MDIDNEIKTIETTCKGKPCLQNCIAQMRRACSRPPLTCHGGGSARGVLWLWVATVLVLLVAVCLAPLCHAQEMNGGSGVTVYIDGEYYTGNSAIVTGNGSSHNPDDYVIVVTNFMGACSNCSAITTSELSEIADNIDSRVETIWLNCEQINGMAYTLMRKISNQQNDISSYTLIPLGSSGNQANQAYKAFTNEVAQGQHGTQGILTLQFRSSINYTSSDSIRNQGAACYANGIYDYATQYVSPSLSTLYAGINEFPMYANSASNQASVIKTTANQLRSVGPCITNDNVNVGVPDLIIREYTNTVYVAGIGKEQIDAITNYLHHIDLDQHMRFNQLNTISNNVAYAVTNMDIYARQVIDALYSNRTTIPDEEGLSVDVPTTWQDVYLAGRPTSWGYNPTNVLERIEVLLYGISGVGTNGDDVASVPSDASSSTRQIISLVEGMETDVEVNQDKVESLGQEILGFFSTFTSFAGRAMTQNEEILPSVKITWNEKKVDIPAITSNGDVSTWNNFAVFLRAVCVVLYILGALLLVWYYWAWFSKYAIAFVKWASEIVNSVLAS